jgi:NADH dehydrogenase [ubiquinone] 1 alpha subcomplex assembly factor 5
MVDAADIIIFDRSRLQKNRARTAANIQKYDFLHRWVSSQITERLQDIKHSFIKILQIGGTVPMAQNAFHMDIGKNIISEYSNLSFMGDEEFLPIKKSFFDLIISSLTLHATNDLPGALVQLKRALKPDGLFIAAMFGGETLRELRESLMHAEMELKGGASPRVFPFADKPQMGNLMQRAGYALPVVDSEIVTVTYENLFKLMHDLRGMGETNIILKRNNAYMGREFFSRAADYYAKNFSEPGGRIRASFEIIFLLGWSPHESQQKPLKPGSATIRLADALDTKEIYTGEKAAP